MQTNESIQQSAVNSNPPRRTLTLDLGTDTGWALADRSGILKSGTLCLATDAELEHQRREGRERTLDLRYSRIHAFITEHIFAGVDRIVFEDVEFASTRMQTQLWASLRTAIWAGTLTRPDLSIKGLPVATLKQFATGNGHVQKFAMAQALAKLQPAEYTLVGESIRKADGSLADDNEIDAIWLALYTQAVDRGERDFRSVYQRKQIAAAERRKKKICRRERDKAKRAGKLALTKLRKAAIKNALRSLDRCCGVFRKLVHRLGVCPKCGSKVPLPKLTAAVLGAREPQPNTIHDSVHQTF